MFAIACTRRRWVALVSKRRLFSLDRTTTQEHNRASSLRLDSLGSLKVSGVPDSKPLSKPFHAITAQVFHTASVANSLLQQVRCLRTAKLKDGGSARYSEHCVVEVMMFRKGVGSRVGGTG